MNERINRLAYDAGLLNYVDTAPEPTESKIVYFPRTVIELEDVHKFAEMLIKECVGLAKLANLSNTSLDVVKEHFGIEE